MSAIFKTVAWQVGQLVSFVSNGTIQLPDLQRPFVWPATKVRDLFDSMYRGYPVGELMFWDVPADGETRSISGATDLAAAHQIVDGQQRLTSLYAAIRGLPVRDENYRQKAITLSFNPFTEKFDVRTPALAKSPQWVEDISTCFDSPLEAAQKFVQRLEASGESLTNDESLALMRVFIKLDDIRKYQFDIVHIQNDVDKRTVADIFVRINSEGVSLKAYDYILTWLSVFWPGGREEIEDFARNSRVSPDRASEIADSRIDWTAKNPYINVETGHLVRAMVALGQNRAKLADAYSALQAKERTTGAVNPERQERELQKLKDALPVVTNKVNWTEFIRSIQSAGFRSRKGITSTTNLISSYVVFLLGRTRFDVDLPVLRNLIGRWFFMSQLTSRYTGSGESQLQKDIDLFSQLSLGDSAGFQRLIDESIANSLTGDFWTFNLPQALVTSGAALSPAYQCYLAGLNILGADMFMLRMPVGEWMDPTMPAVKGLEGHHLFPRKYQENVLGITDTKRINQAANFAPTDWDTNILISDRAPMEYWPELLAKRGNDLEWLKMQRYWHALPDNWESLDYDEFLQRRRQMIAQVTHDAFDKLANTTFVSATLPPTESLENELAQLTFEDVLTAGVLHPGDNLTPVDESSDADAVVTEDGTVLINGTHTFDTLDDAARYLGVENISGIEYWALELDGEVTPLTELVRESTAA